MDEADAETAWAEHARGRKKVMDFTSYKLLNDFEADWGMTIDTHYLEEQQGFPGPPERNVHAELITGYAIGHLRVDWVDGDPRWSLTPEGEAALWRGEMTGIPGED